MQEIDTAEEPQEETYWAAKAPDDLHDECLAKIDEYWRDSENTAFAELISRNWCYYHGIFQGTEDFNILGGAIQRMGPQGERSFMGVNNFRNLLQHLFVLTTRDRAAPKSVAVNTEFQAMMDSQVVDAVLDEYLREKRVERYFNRCAEQAIVATRGIVTVDWSKMLGKAVDGDVSRMSRTFEGDMQFGNPTIFDCVKDNEIRDGWESHQWLLVRDWPNKYDLAAEFPDKRTEILGSMEPDHTVLWGKQRDRTKSDRVGRWTFWHDRTAALQTGRKFTFVRGAWLEGGPLPAYLEKKPVYACTPNEVLFTGDGYSPGFDLQGPQEALNMTISNILTNHDTFGIQNIWSPTGNNLSVGQISGGLRVLQSKVKPEPLQLTLNPSDAYKFLEALNMYMELLSGINSVTRGQPDSILKSGKALSIVEAKAVQFASRLIASYVELVEDVCTAMVKILSVKLQEGSPRVTRIAGTFGTYLRAEYTGSTLKSVERVRVEMGNPLLKTISGRMDMAEFFVKNGWVKTPEEIMSVFNTGRLEPIMQADRAMLAGLAAEKDALMKGEVAPVLKTDYHSLHIREEMALLNTPMVRMEQELAANVLGHVLVHVAMLYLPDVRDLQLAQGYQVPPLSPMIPPGLLDQVGPEYQDSFTDVDRVFFNTPMQAAPVGPASPQQPGGAPAPQAPPEAGPSPLETEPEGVAA